MIDDSLTLDNTNIPNCYGNGRNYVYYMFNHTVDLKCIFYPPNTHPKLHTNAPNKEEGIPTWDFPKRKVPRNVIQCVPPPSISSRPPMAVKRAE
jgi:hypothetical protein